MQIADPSKLFPGNLALQRRYYAQKSITQSDYAMIGKSVWPSSAFPIKNCPYPGMRLGGLLMQPYLETKGDIRALCLTVAFNEKILKTIEVKNSGGQVVPLEKSHMNSYVKKLKRRYVSRLKRFA